MKKFLVLLLVLILALTMFSLVSCGEPEEPYVKPNPSDLIPPQNGGSSGGSGIEDIIPDWGEGVEGPIVEY